MRITAEEKLATRARILKVARRLFQKKGFEETTVRDIASEAHLAAGTLFNYFDSKEEVAVALALEAIGRAEKTFLERRRVDSSLEEDLFLHIAAQLRVLKPLRTFIQPVIETALSPAVVDDRAEASQQLRAHQLDGVGNILRAHGIDADRWSMTVPIYWALYVGVLSFWAKDKSAKQEETLAMLDQAINMFVSWLTSGD